MEAYGKAGGDILVKRHKECADLFQPQYEEIARSWIKRHIMAGFWLALGAALLESIFVFGIQMERFDLSLFQYALKFLILPSGCNFLAVGLTVAAGRSCARPKTCAVATTLAHVFIIFCIYTVHARFPAIYLGFAIPVIFTVVYGSPALTIVAALGGLAAKTLSDLFIRWDPLVMPKFDSLASGLNYAISLCTLIFIDAACLLIIGTERQKHRASFRDEREKLRLYLQSVTDPLTGLQNRNGLRTAFDQMLQDETNRPYWFIMIDMDRFKTANDTYGHAVGDQYLKQISAVLKSLTGAQPFRYGGDEFCLLICDRDREEVERICQTAQERFADAPNCKSVCSMTLSFGAAAYKKGMPPADLVRQADRALYQAKRDRGSICFYQESVA
jgi:diguanylate cyclase